MITSLSCVIFVLGKGSWHLPTIIFPYPSNPASSRATDTQKIVLERQLADLGMKGFQIDGWRSGFGTSLSPEYPGRPFEELRLPLGDLVGMDIELLRQIGQRLLAFDRGQSHFRLEG